MSIHYDLIILGAGAAGLMAALQAAERGLCCAVLDHAATGGKKLAVAGGGMGNYTNRHMGPQWYIGKQPDFCAPSLKGFSPQHTLKLLERFGIAWEERDHGRLFGTSPASLLAKAMHDAAESLGTVFYYNQHCIRVEKNPQGLFCVHSEEQSWQAPRLLIALGSPAWPQAGATALGTQLARQLGHRVEPLRPVLTPFIMPQSWPLHGLSGISCPVSLHIGGQSFTDSLLFTHKGLSGPVVLQASCFYGTVPPLATSLLADFLPGQDVLALLHEPAHGKLMCRSLFERLLPARLAEILVPETLAARKVAELGKKDRQLLAESLHRYRLEPLRTEGMNKAEAAAGGVDTREVCPKTLRSLLCEGLYFAGEVLDVTGLLGGYNLHWAFASAHAAAVAAARSNGSVPGYYPTSF